MATIQYKMNGSGFVANITIYDAQGRPVRYLVKNGILGSDGQWNWDGLDEKGNKLPIGTYIIYTEIFNLQAKKQQFKNTVVLARKVKLVVNKNPGKSPGHILLWFYIFLSELFFWFYMFSCMDIFCLYVFLKDNQRLRQQHHLLQRPWHDAY